MLNIYAVLQTAPSISSLPVIHCSLFMAILLYIMSQKEVNRLEIIQQDAHCATTPLSPQMRFTAVF